MANILTAPLSGNIYFDSCASQHTSTPDLSGNAVSLGFDGCAGLTITSYNEDSQDRLTVAGSSGTLFSVNDSLEGTIFSVNDAAGLPIIEVNSDATTDTVAIGEFGTNALFVSAGNVGVGTNTPTSPLHVCGNIAVTGTVDGRDIASDGSKLDCVATGATSCTGTVTCIATSGGITGGPITGSGTLGINSTCNTKWDQSGCPGICCTGTTTASNTQTFTNKSGNISQWTNDSGYTTCTGTGDILSVCGGSLLNNSGSNSQVTLNVDLSELTDGTAAVVPTTDEIVYLDAGSQKRKLFSEIFGCNAYSNTAFTTCTGTITNLAGLGVTATAAELNYVDGVTSNIKLS